MQWSGYVVEVESLRARLRLEDWALSKGGGVTGRKKGNRGI